MDRIILWLSRTFLRPLTEGLHRMAKDSEAVAELKALLDQQDSAISAVEADISADEETDYAAIQPLVEKARANNQRLAGLVGVSETVSPSTPVDAVTGQPVVTPSPIDGEAETQQAEQAGTSGTPTTQDNPTT